MSEIKKSKLSIQDIKISKKREKLDYSSRKQSINDNLKYPLKKNKKKWLKIVAGSTIFIVIFIVISIVFHSTHIIIKPKTENIIFTGSDVYTAIWADETEAELPLNTIQYQIFPLVFISETIIDTMAVKNKEEQATGKIKIINNSNRTQKLRKETRFRIDDKIFMTYKSVTIPANSSVVAEAFATESGAEYNLKSGVKLDIPGFEEVNSPLFTKITGEIYQSFTGGFIGKINIPNKNDLEKAESDAIEELKLLANQEIANKITENYILVDYKISQNFSHKTSSDGNKVLVSSSLDIKAIVFNKKEFMSVVGYLDEELIIVDITELNFNILPKKDFSVDSEDDFNFNLMGKIKMSQKFNEDTFVTLIKGANKKEVKEKLKDNFTNFKIEISIIPFWRSSIPNNIDNIKVELLKN